jgi:hypothetical protein
MVYLEDDLNDNAFNFGAAMERYLFTNGVLEAGIRKCERMLATIAKEDGREDQWLISPRDN